MKDFSVRLQKLMEKRQINQSDLSRYTGVSQQAISFYLSGKVEPQSIEILYKLSKYFRVTLFELTGLESLKGIEQEADAVGELSAEEKAIVEAYNSLPDDDWRRKAVDEILLKTKEVEKKKNPKDKAE